MQETRFYILLRNFLNFFQKVNDFSTLPSLTCITSLIRNENETSITYYIRGRSITTWTRFRPFLTPSPPSHGQTWTFQWLPTYVHMDFHDSPPPLEFALILYILWWFEIKWTKQNIFSRHIFLHKKNLIFRFYFLQSCNNSLFWLFKSEGFNYLLHTFCPRGHFKDPLPP